MILASALLLAAVAALPAEDRIVVIGRKLAETRVDWTTRRRNGAMEIRRCKVTHSSGDAELDNVVCQAMKDCARHIPPGAREGDPLPEFFACTDERSLALGR